MLFGNESTAGQLKITHSSYPNVIHEVYIAAHYNAIRSTREHNGEEKLQYIFGAKLRLYKIPSVNTFPQNEKQHIPTAHAANIF